MPLGLKLSIVSDTLCSELNLLLQCSTLSLQQEISNAIVPFIYRTPVESRQPPVLFIAASALIKVSAFSQASAVSVAPQLRRDNSFYYQLPVSVAYGIISTGIKYCKGMNASVTKR
jgi:hypothetical protein